MAMVKKKPAFTGLKITQDKSVIIINSLSGKKETKVQNENHRNTVALMFVCSHTTQLLQVL
jgi:hypothetical protein